MSTRVSITAAVIMKVSSLAGKEELSSVERCTLPCDATPSSILAIADSMSIVWGIDVAGGSK